MRVDIIDDRKCDIILKYLETFNFKSKSNNGTLNTGSIMNELKDKEITLHVESIGSDFFVKTNDTGLYLGFWVSEWMVNFND